MGNDQVMIGIHSDLHVVADDARAAAAGCHRATVGVGQRYLLVGRSQHLLLVDGKLAHLLLHLRQLLLESRHLRGQRFGRLLPVGGVKLAQIAGNALLQLGTPPLHLCPREVPVPVVHGLELAAIDGNARRREKAHLTAKLNEARTDLAEPQAVVLAEVRDRLVIRHEPAQQPHDFDIATGLSLQPPARLHPVKVAVDVKLQENRGMVRRPSGRRRVHPIEAHFRQIERIDKHVDHANRVAFVNEIIEAFGQQRRLPTIRLFNEATHQFSPENHRGNHSSAMAFSHSQGQSRWFGDVRGTSALPLKADVRCEDRQVRKVLP